MSDSPKRQSQVGGLPLISFADNPWRVGVGDFGGLVLECPHALNTSV